jgi:hypothetical protein
MVLYIKRGKCAYCNTAGHNLKYCVDSTIPERINGLEQSIANCYTRNNIMLFLQRQPSINVRILARKHRLSTSLQKGFLIDRLTPIYYNIHKSVRLRELGVFIHEHLTPVEPLYEINTFRIDQLAHYLYTHLINEVNCIYDENEDDASTLITKLAYISNTLNTLYREVYHLNLEKLNRYYEWMEYIYEIIMNMHHTLRVQLTYNLQEPEDETPSTPNRPDITPYILVSSSRTFRNTIESCPICYDDIHPNEKIQFKCGHMLCNKCTHIHVDTSAPNLPQCVLCRAEIREIYTTNKTIYAEWDL